MWCDVIFDQMSFGSFCYASVSILCWQLQSEFMILFTFLIRIEIVCLLSFHISKYNEKRDTDLMKKKNVKKNIRSVTED